MSSANRLPPSAPPAENERGIYPSLPEMPNAENFRLTEISRIEKEISSEVEHYRLVLKKYKKARKALHYSVVGLALSRQLCLLGLSQHHSPVVELLSAHLLPGLPLYLALFPLACPLSTRSLNAKSISTRESILWLLRNMTRLTSPSHRLLMIIGFLTRSFN